MSHRFEPWAPGETWLGVSACLLGERVRYDGGHKQDRFVTNTLGQLFRLLPLCPEVAIGLGTPRPPIRLEGSAASPRAVNPDNRRQDVTESLRAHGRRTADKLAGISGYIFKSRSPSCGVFGVTVHDDAGRRQAHGTGIYAREVMRALPMLPVEEEDRLDDWAIRENFLERVFAYRRWQQLYADGLTARGLLRFHADHKLVLMAHGREPLQTLGRLLADLSGKPIEQTAANYGRVFMQAVRLKATRQRHADVLFHLAGYLKHTLEREAKAELVEMIHAYRRGDSSRSVPLTLLRQHFRRHPHPYVENQVYLQWPLPDLAIPDEYPAQ